MAQDRLLVSPWSASLEQAWVWGSGQGCPGPVTMAASVAGTAQLASIQCGYLGPPPPLQGLPPCCCHQAQLHILGWWQQWGISTKIATQPAGAGSGPPPSSSLAQSGTW